MTTGLHAWGSTLAEQPGQQWVLQRTTVSGQPVGVRACQDLPSEARSEPSAHSSAFWAGAPGAHPHACRAHLGPRAGPERRRGCPLLLGSSAQRETGAGPGARGAGRSFWASRPALQ